jgi:hypothetical protein
MFVSTDEGIERLAFLLLVESRLLMESDAELMSLSWRTPTMYLIPVAVLPSFLYAIGQAPKSPLLTDILSMSFSYNALTLLKLDSFATGCVVLSGLFLYDIWWVFGTEVVSIHSFHPQQITNGMIDGKGCNEP